MQSDLGAYLPQDRRSALRRGVALPNHASGIVIFTDVTGFTPIAEAFAQALGPRRGAEELTALLNQVYSVLIAQIEAFGGSVISFSGDAMTCWFDDKEAGGGVPPALWRAVACALGMREAMAAFANLKTPGGPAALSVKTALASGPVRRFQIGDPRIQLLDTLAGSTLDRLSASARLAERADIVADPQTLAAIEPLISVEAWRSDPETGARVGIIAGLAAPIAPTPPAPQPGSALPEEELRPWLLPTVYARLRHSAAPFLAELRPAIALMLQFSGFDYENDAVGAQLDDYIRRIQQIVARYEGALIDVTMADKGGYLYVAFGAPIAHEDDAGRALKAALELRQLEVTPRHSTVRIGLSRGTMRAGPYGGPSRCAYGVLGDEVNLACRLMSAAAPGQILVSGQLQQALSDTFSWHALPMMRVRGKQLSIEVYQLTDWLPGSAAPRQLPTAGMVARAAERAALAEATRALLAGVGGVLVIEGEPGIGKSRLIAELAAGLRAGGAACLAGAGQGVEQETAYRAWRDLMAAYFELDAGTPAARRQAQVLARAKLVIPDLIERLPLLNDLLGLGLPDTALTSSLSGKLRSDVLDELLSELLQRRAAQGPLVLVLEDAQWLDSRSWALAARVARSITLRTDTPLLLAITTRALEANHPGLPHMQAVLAAEGVRWLRLSQLGPDDTSALAAAQLGLADDGLPAHLAAWLHQRAGGNPLFVEELIATMRQRGLVWIEFDSAHPLAPPRCRVADELQRIDHLLPATLQGLLLARLDRLPPEQQQTLKVAAVVGPTFAFHPLLFAHNCQSAIEAPELRTQLRALASQDYTALEEPDPNLAYRFKHVLTQEAAYETLLFAQRRVLHSAVAEWYEQSTAGEEASLAPHLPLLAYHYRRAESPERERHYSWLAGLQAAEQFANVEAISFLTRALELTPADDLAGRFSVLFEREAAEELLALREDQARDLAALADIAEALDDNRKRAEIARNQARYAERLGNIVEMRALAARAVALAEAAGATDLAIEAYDQWAWACLRVAAYDEGRELAEAGLRLARMIGDRRNEAQLLVAIGCAYGESENAPLARAYLEQSRQIFRELGRQRGESIALGNLGEVLAQQGDYTTARAYFTEALQLYRATGDRRNEGWVLGNLGAAAMQLGDYQAARDSHGQAAMIARRAGDRNTECIAMIDLGLIAHLLGEHTAALEYAGQAMRAATVTSTRIRGLLLSGHALAAIDRLPDAVASYTQARDLAQTAGLRTRVAEAAAGLARVALAQGDIAAARALVQPLLAALEQHALVGADEPLRVYLTSYQTLRATDDQRADTILAAAYALLQSRAALIADDQARQLFLEQVPYHRELLREVLREGRAIPENAPLSHH